MKILLYGEFSGLHTNLKKGLKENGYEVTLVSFGDDFKNFDGDIKINPNKFKNKYINFISFQLTLFWLLIKLKGYDIVQLISISQLVIPKGRFGRYFVNILRKRNNKVYLNSCGDDIFVILGFIKQEYSPFQNEIKAGLNWRLFHFCKKSEYYNSMRIVNSLDGVIASNSTYHNAYHSFENYKGYIPMPTIVREDKKKNIVKDKVKIFFGIGSRRPLKGVEYILEALKKVETVYPEKVDIIIVEKIPYKEYITLFDECNIFIDQACSYSYGMNALLGLGNSKVVLSGNEPIVEELLGTSCPVLNIKPNSEDIFNKIELLINNQELIPEISSKSYNFAKEFHDYSRVAKRYELIWNQ